MAEGTGCSCVRVSGMCKLGVFFFLAVCRVLRVFGWYQQYCAEGLFAVCVLAS